MSCQSLWEAGEICLVQQRVFCDKHQNERNPHHYQNQQQQFREGTDSFLETGITQVVAYILPESPPGFTSLSSAFGVEKRTAVLLPLIDSIALLPFFLRSAIQFFLQIFLY